MKLIITIDTEEDDWGFFKPSDHSLSNILEIPNLQNLFDEFKVKPTYLITYPVATNDAAIEIFKRIAGDNQCEIGAHCHPWNTPPFDEETNAYNSMLCNLPYAMQYNKIEALHKTIKKRLGVRPVSFRAGRYGFNGEVAENLCKLGFKVDTSVSPLCDWYEYHGPDFTDACQTPYRVDFYGPASTTSAQGLIEIPVTIGFLQKNQKLCRVAFKTFKSRFPRNSGLLGALNRLRLLNLVWLSPELSSSNHMIRLSKTFHTLGHSFLNMSFHSTSLLQGKSPFVQDRSELDGFYARIRTFLRFTLDWGIESVTLSEAAAEFCEETSQ